MRRLAFLAAASIGLGVVVIVDQPAADASSRRPKFSECFCSDLDRDGKLNPNGTQ